VRSVLVSDDWGRRSAIATGSDHHLAIVIIRYDSPIYAIGFNCPHALPVKFVLASFSMRQTDAIDDSYNDTGDCSQARANQHQTEGHIRWGTAWVRRSVFVITERQDPTKQQTAQGPPPLHLQADLPMKC